MPYNEDIPTLKIFFYSYITNKEKINCQDWPQISLFRCYTGYFICTQCYEYHLTSECVKNETNMSSATLIGLTVDEKIYTPSIVTDPFFAHLLRDSRNLSPL